MPLPGSSVAGEEDELNIEQFIENLKGEVKRGLLEKKGTTGLKRWQGRYFEVDGNRLSYRKTEGGAEEGLFDLTGAEISVSDEDNVIIIDDMTTTSRRRSADAGGSASGNSEPMRLRVPASKDPAEAKRETGAWLRRFRDGSDLIRRARENLKDALSNLRYAREVEQRNSATKIQSLMRGRTARIEAAEKMAAVTADGVVTTVDTWLAATRQDTGNTTLTGPEVAGLRHTATFLVLLEKRAAELINSAPFLPDTTNQSRGVKEALLSRLDDIIRDLRAAVSELEAHHAAACAIVLARKAEEEELRRRKEEARAEKLSQAQAKPPSAVLKPTATSSTSAAAASSGSLGTAKQPVGATAALSGGGAGKSDAQATAPVTAALAPSATDCTPASEGTGAEGGITSVANNTSLASVVLMSGTLTKKAHKVMSSNTKRYFELAQDGELTYFTDPSKKVQKGQVSLIRTSAAGPVLAYEFEATSATQFKLKPAAHPESKRLDRVYELIAPSQAEMEQWQKSIQGLVKQT